MISFYTELSQSGHPFKARKDYDIDWKKVMEVSSRCGMILMTEHLHDGLILRVTSWSRDSGYDEWLADEYIQQYIDQRDSYNKDHNIVSNLTIWKP